MRGVGGKKEKIKNKTEKRIIKTLLPNIAKTVEERKCCLS